MNKTLTITSIILGAALLAVSFLYLTQGSTALGSGYIGWPVHQQAGSNPTVGPDSDIQLFADAADCKARVVTTKETNIYVSFDDDYIASTSLSTTYGHLQAASTTVAYESGVYGCGAMYAHAGASTTLTISSF